MSVNMSVAAVNPVSYNRKKVIQPVNRLLKKVAGSWGTARRGEKGGDQ
jgi:hypothetical protein